MAMFGAGADFGMPQLDPSVQQPLAQPLQLPAPKKKGGLFGSGSGVTIDLSRALAGYLAGIGNPAGIQALQSMNAQRQQQQASEQEQTRYQQRREDGYSDWVKQQMFKLAHPDQASPHYFEDNSGNQWAIGPDGQPRMVHKDDLPFKLVPNGMGGVVPVDLRALMASQDGPPQTLSDDDWPTGGPTPQASGGFPRPR